MLSPENWKPFDFQRLDALRSYITKCSSLDHPFNVLRVNCLTLIKELWHFMAINETHYTSETLDDWERVIDTFKGNSLFLPIIDDCYELIYDFRKKLEKQAQL